METTDSASSRFQPMRQSEIRYSSSPTYAYGGNELSLYSSKESSPPPVPSKSSDKIHKKVKLPPEIKDRSRTHGRNDGHRATTHFEPRSELSDDKRTELSELELPTDLQEFLPSIAGTSPLDAPEKKLTLFAQHLAFFEKSANALGRLAFIWATVVLLGGFASALKLKDFWFVTIILVIEGARLFTRSGELEWHHQSTRTLPAATSYRRMESTFSFSNLEDHPVRRLPSFASRLCRRLAYNLRRLNGLTALSLLKGTWLPANLPYSCWVFVSKNISRLLYGVQVLAAVACVALSSMRLGQQDYGEDAEINEKSALNVFYGLALAEALMFLLETGYWTWKIRLRKLFEQVNNECGLGELHGFGIVSLRRFFYDAYSKCVNGSIFDGLKMDLVSYAEELLNSDSLDEQIIGASILKIFIESKKFADDTLRKIGSSTSVIERLIEMLNWKDPAEIYIRCAASVIVSKLATRKQNALRVVAIPGAMESIASLLQTSRKTTDGRTYEASPPVDERHISILNQKGLLILKGLARDHENCWKIGNARGLLARIIDLMSFGEVLLRDRNASEQRIRTGKSALETVKILVCTTGETGKTLRRDISKIVYLLSYIRELLQHGERYLELQVLGVEILTSLGMNKDAREKIGATGSMIRLILDLFFRLTEDETICNKVAEALAMLILESKTNCKRMLMEDSDVVQKLVHALDRPALRLNVMMILRSLCAYSAPELSSKLCKVVEAMPMVLKTIMEEKKEKKKLLEVSVGLAEQILNFRNPQVCGNEKEKFVEKLVEILRIYKNPKRKVPRMRRFVIGLAITLMKRDRNYIKLFGDLGMKQVLVQTAETTSELECFNVFSGSQGLGNPEVMISSLVDTALELLDRNQYFIRTPDAILHPESNGGGVIYQVGT